MSGDRKRPDSDLKPIIELEDSLTAFVKPTAGPVPVRSNAIAVPSVDVIFIIAVRATLGTGIWILQGRAKQWLPDIAVDDFLRPDGS